MKLLLRPVVFLSLLVSFSSAFTITPTPQVRRSSSSLAVTTNHQEEEDGPTKRDAKESAAQRNSLNRREMLLSVSAGISTAAVCVSTGAASAAADPLATDSLYKAAVRPTVYRVDSTIPPTLLPVPTAREQVVLLKDLGRGLGTDKAPVFIDRLNLNNILQKAVYGTAAAVNNLVSTGGKNQGGEPAPASFVCFGLPVNTGTADINLSVSLMQSIFAQAVKSNKRTAIGVAVFPYSSQAALDDFVAGRITLPQLQEQTIGEISAELFRLYQPVLDFAASNNNKVDLIAMGVSEADRTTVSQQGLQNVNPESRALYVADTAGFIATTSDPKFKVYTDRSLLKDFSVATDTANKQPNTGNFFAERILVHEAGATALARYAVRQQEQQSIICVLAAVPDVRYLGGINGRLPRVYQYLAKTTQQQQPASTVGERDVTTILLNPTPADTLSKTRRLRLEIGTGPETLPYQTKVADYLWFSSNPAVSLLPRMMDY